MSEEVAELHVPCEDCGSSDARVIYTSGWSHCFSCETNRKVGAGGDEEERPVTNKVKSSLAPIGEYIDMPKRGLRLDTCKKFGYSKSNFRGTPCHVAPYHDDKGKVIGQKLRFAGKDFSITGTLDNKLFGRKLWQSGGKRLVITEGEIDAMSYSQVTNLSWPVVSVPNGAAAAYKSIKANIDWIESFEVVVFMFDSDEPGQKAAQECAEILTPGKAAIARLPEGYKDANEMLLARKIKELQVAVWNAEVARPDGIINGNSLWDDVNAPVEMGTPFPWKGLNDLTYGMRRGEIIALTAGTGTGKSTICAEIAHHLGNTLKQNVGYVALEDSSSRSGLRLMSIHCNKTLHLPNTKITDDERRKAFDETLGTGRYYFYDHWGSTGADNLLRKLSYLVKGLECPWIILDHLSIVVSGLDLGEDERRAIDNTMTALRSFTEETKCGLILVNHLKRTTKTKSHERGAQVELSDLRGSQSISQLSDTVIAAERDQQSDEDGNLITLRVLKNRYAGFTGTAGTLEYESKTGRLKECGTDFQRELPEEADGEEFD